MAPFVPFPSCLLRAAQAKPISVLQVYELGRQLKLDDVIFSAQAVLVSRPWEGRNLHRLMDLLADLPCAEVKELLHHPQASAFCELQAWPSASSQGSQP